MSAARRSDKGDDESDGVRTDARQFQGVQIGSGAVQFNVYRERARWVAAVVTLVLLVAVAVGAFVIVGPQQLEKVALDPTEIAMPVGKSMTLNLRGTMKDGVPAPPAALVEASWTSSAPAVATVTVGRVTAVSPGSTTITVKIEDHEATAQLTVEEPEPSKVPTESPPAPTLPLAPQPDLNPPAPQPDSTQPSPAPAHPPTSQPVPASPTIRSLKAADVLGPYHLKFGHSGKCLDVPNYSTADVALIQQTCQDEVNQLNQIWHLDHVFTAPNGFDFFRIRNAHSGKCANVSGASLADGAGIIQYTCGDYTNEYFVFWWDTNMLAHHVWVQSYDSWVQSDTSGKVFSISGASRDNGAGLVQYTRCYCKNEYVHLY